MKNMIYTSLAIKLYVWNKIKNLPPNLSRHWAMYYVGKLFIEEEEQGDRNISRKHLCIMEEPKSYRHSPRPTIPKKKGERHSTTLKN